MIEDKDQLQSLRDSMRQARSTGQAAAVAYRLFVLKRVLGLDHHSPLTALEAEFYRRVDAAGWQDMLGRQATYGLRLAQAPGNLEYEEMHKLYSLADEIYAMEQLGFRAGGNYVNEFWHALRLRLAREAAKAQLVAEDRLEDWKRQLWWYDRAAWAGVAPHQ